MPAIERVYWNGQWVTIGSVVDFAQHHWPIDEGSGTTMYDTTGVADIALDHSNWTADSNYPGGYYLEWTGNGGDDSTVTNVGYLDSGQAVSVEISFRATDMSAGLQGIFSRGEQFSDVSNHDWQVRIHNSSNLQVALSGSEVDINEYTEGEIAHLVFRWDGEENGSANAFLNGTEVASWSGMVNDTGTANSFSVGGDEQFEDRTFVGEIGHVIEYDGWLTDQEIQDRYNAMPFA